MQPTAVHSRQSHTQQGGFSARRLLAAGVLGTLMVSLLVQPALAAKPISLFAVPGDVNYDCATGASDTSGPSFGSVRVHANVNANTLSSAFRLHGANPSTTYLVVLKFFNGACTTYAIGSIDTNGSGGGSASFSTPLYSGTDPFNFHLQDQTTASGTLATPSISP